MCPHVHPPILICLSIFWILLIQEGASALPDSLLQASPNELGYAVEHWTVEKGLPNNEILELVQDSQGYLWWTSSYHLVRFDGVRCQTFEIATETQQGLQKMSRVYSDEQGNVFVTGRGGQVYRFAEQKFHPMFNPSDLEMSMDLAHSDGRGGIWIARRGPNHFLLRSGQPNGSVVSATDTPIPNVILDDIRRDSEGHVWLTAGERLYQFHEGHLTPQPLELQKDIFDGNLYALFDLADSKMGLVGSLALWQLNDSNWVPKHILPNNLPNKFSARACVQDRRGNIWIGTRLHGLYLLQPNGEMIHIKIPGLRETLGFNAALLDREGNVWLATPDGLFQIREIAFRAITLPETLTKNRVSALGSDSEGQTWFFPEFDPPFYLSAEGNHPQKIPWEIPHANKVPRILRSQGGGVWLSDGRFLWRWENQILTSLGRLPGPIVPQTILEGLAEFEDNTLIIATGGKGLWSWKQGVYHQIDFPEPIRNSGALVAGGGSTPLYTWIGGLLYQATSSGWVLKNLPEAAHQQRVTCLHVDPDGVVWFGGIDPPLSCWQNDQWFPFKEPASVLPVFATDITTDPDGGLWIMTEAQGIAQFDRSSLLMRTAQPFFDITPTWFGIGDGLPSLAGAHWGTSLTVGNDGRLWAATTKGVAVMDPVEWKEKGDLSEIPKICIEEVILDDVPIFQASSPDLPSPASITIPPGKHRIGFVFTALGLTKSQDNLFRFKLENFEDHWNPPQRQRSVHYSNLPPGDYRFRVIAANGFGKWNSIGSTLALRVEPSWWQRKTTQMAGAFLLLSAAVWQYLASMRRLEHSRFLKEKFAHQVMNSQEEERKRIAGELHDGLGQELLLIKATSQMARKQVDDLSPVRERLDSIIQLTSQALGSVRRLASDLRPVALDRLGLNKAVEALAQQIASNDSVHVTWDVHHLDSLTNADSRVNLYRILQECFSNTLKHAQAQTITLTSQISNSHLVLQFQDDGIGFSHETKALPKNEGGHGLKNIRERIEILKGTMQIETNPGKGTQFIFSIPLKENQ